MKTESPMPAGPRLRLVTILLAAALVALHIAPAGAQLTLQPGKYQQTMTMSRDGQTIPFTLESCIASEDVADLAAMLGEEPEDDCKLSNLKIQGGRMTFTISCTDDGEAIRSEADLRFATTSYSGSVTTTAGGEVYVTRLSGKRIGPCDPQ